MRASGQWGDAMEVRDGFVHSSTSLATKRGLNEPERSTQADQGEAEARCLAHKTYDSQKLLCTFLCNAVEANGKKEIHWAEMIQSKFSQEGFKCCKKKKALLSGGVLMTTTTPQYISWNWITKAVQNLRWSSQGKGTDKVQLNIFLCPLWCVQCAPKQTDLTICKPWLESWILMLLRPRRALSEARDSSSGNNKDKEDNVTRCPVWTGAIQAHTPLSKPDHLHSLPVPLQTTNPCQSRAFKMPERSTADAV